jgi:PEP-CTERM motif
LFLAILNPVSDNSGNWHSGTLWSALGVVGGSTFPNLSSAISQDFGATGVTAASFNVSDVNIGTWTMNPQTVTLPTGEPAGTLILAFTELPNGNLGLVTPWSSSLGTTGGTTPTPEPSSVILLGVGLIGLVALKRVIV